MKHPFAKFLQSCAVALSAFGLVAADASAQSKTSLLVYTAIETDAMKMYKTAFEKAHPNIEIRWVRDSTGVITAKLMSEKANPQADVVLGVAASSLALLSQENMLLPYEPAGFKELNQMFSDQKRPPHWVGMDVWGAVVCFNTVEAKKLNLPKPESWKDLTKPVYRGKITMPHPASSGTGYLDVTAWLQMWGEQQAWQYMDALHENVAQYVHSGSKPCKQAGSGEFPIGISFEFRAHQVLRSGAPIELIFPKEGLGWDIEGSGIIKQTKHVDAAKKLVDWMASKEANQISANWWAIVAYPGVAKKMEGIPENYEALLVKPNDFDWAAKNRDRILTEWSKRYNAKAEPGK
ncbi:putative 2-aminoethylphosphonate ABC transporter substrate-binding protein [Noviherbaspirillum saxi]|uniref:Putative 2-aminoethylphosphonate ABC transporter substrate-binding protein n=1 Tax=Noviherbaspirillum saxi TaxID=2320863 RepID=A0A3A3FPF3_9BURK|nr:putative 2-aminoethylphosphonate ABC transporter substrate-binding protein [Noviherbaspirillum saxi]RJF98062.1 putative 2-aminoethylphosphonate ABC transporter substrate-binding protein [Noviherbaspirillum saxi]